MYSNENSDSGYSAVVKCKNVGACCMAIHAQLLKKKLLARRLF